MKTPHRTAAPIALALLLASLAPAPAWAQTAAKPGSPGATKSFGNGKAGGKLLTRDELRACMKMEADMKSGGDTLERDKAELEQQKAALQQDGEALKSAKDEVMRKRQEAGAGFRAKAEAHAQRVQEFNRKTAELAEVEKQSHLSANRAQRMRRELEAEQAQIKSDDDALRKEMDALNRGNADEANALNARVAQYEQSVRSWNERNDAFTARVNQRRAAEDRWSAECADRPYAQNDETAIQQGR